MTEISEEEGLALKWVILHFEKEAQCGVDTVESKVREVSDSKLSEDGQENI